MKLIEFQLLKHRHKVAINPMQIQSVSSVSSGYGTILYMTKDNIVVEEDYDEVVAMVNSWIKE